MKNTVLKISNGFQVKNNDGYVLKLTHLKQFDYKYRLYMYVCSGFDNITGEPQFNKLVKTSLSGTCSLATNGKHIGLGSLNYSDVRYSLKDLPSFIKEFSSMFISLEKAKEVAHS